MIEYTPPARNGRNNVELVEAALKAAVETFGAYPFSNRALAQETGLTLAQTLATVNYVLRRKGWETRPGVVALKADPRLDGRELRRLTVLVPTA